MWERCKLPELGPRRSPGRKRIWCTLKRSESHWWQSFWIMISTYSTFTITKTLVSAVLSRLVLPLSHENQSLTSYYVKIAGAGKLSRWKQISSYHWQGSFDSLWPSSNMISTNSACRPLMRFSFREVTRKFLDTRKWVWSWRIERVYFIGCS